MVTQKERCTPEAWKVPEAVRSVAEDQALARLEGRVGRCTGANNY